MRSHGGVERYARRFVVLSAMALVFARMNICTGINWLSINGYKPMWRKSDEESLVERLPFGSEPNDIGGAGSDIGGSKPTAERNDEAVERAGDRNVDADDVSLAAATEVDPELFLTCLSGSRCKLYKRSIPVRSSQPR
ncbi:hypothetical protein [Roseovarius arcticus]|uniref:hypothetical protein n=1 Tax=Roseovarius arcticus TaxID=2547404 RepID=UPI0014865399|nr:hypothetical protein [Roseovarius arcticus]